MNLTEVFGTDQISAFEKRQLDTDWGYAFAHLLPIVPLYYAITRRTITPGLYILAGTLTIGFIAGLAAEKVTPDVRDAANIAGILATPFLAKVGINQAREFGADKLKLPTA